MQETAYQDEKGRIFIMKICNFWSKKGHFSKIKGVLFREKGAYRLLLEKAPPLCLGHWETISL